MKEYIERAIVLNLLEKINPVDFGSMFDYKAHEAVGECLREIRYGVEDIPAADVAEVRHGYWIDLNAENATGPLFKCSECSHLHNPNRDDLELERVELNPLYCDACGARMDKEDEHEQ